MVMPALLESMFSLTHFDLGLSDCCYCVPIQHEREVRGPILNLLFVYCKLLLVSTAETDKIWKYE